MRKKGIAVAAVMVGLLAGTTRAEASFVNAPHNTANGIDCVNCHEYPFDRWPGYVPDQGNLDDTVKNFICLRCHDGTADAPGEIAAPVKGMHSSLNLSNKYGDWTTQCVDCHDPHFQAQVDHYQTDAAALYLVTGTYGPVSVTTADPNNPATTTTSTFGYTLVSVDPAWSNPATWSAKTGTAGRGLILVADTANPYDTFEVVAADGTTITVAGDLSQVAKGATFGLIYGQLVRAEIATPNSGVKPVKFFNPAGGHVELNTATPTGICQVCHTLTNNWRNDGTVSVSAADHNTGTNCTSCHHAADGFRFTVPDHTVVDSLGNIPIQDTPECVTCHTYTDPVADIHGSNCTWCHTSAPNLQPGLAAGPCAGCHPNRDPSGHVSEHDNTAYDTTPALDCGACHGTTMNINTYHVGRTVARGNIGSAAPGTVIECATCHSSTVAAVTDAIAKGRSSNPTPQTVYCADCHGARPADHPNDVMPVHTWLLKTGTVCETCHDAAGTADIVADIHNNTCANCHNLPDYASLRTGVNGDATLHGPVGQGNQSACTVCHDPAIYPTSAFHHATSNAQTGNCTFCHAGSAAADHSTMVADYANCTTCHAANVGSAGGAPVDPADDRVHDACTTCHNTDGSLKTVADLTRGIVVAMPAGGAASNDGGGDCSACHGEYFPNHTHHFTGNNDVTFNPTTDTSQPGVQPCSDCHHDYDVINGTALAFSTFTQILWEHDTDGVKDGSTNTCANCHNYDGSKSAPLADVQNAIGSGNPATCATCHTDKVPNVAHGGHTDTDFGWAGNCGDCHGTGTEPVVSVIHNNDCAICHVNPSAGDYTRKAGDAANGVDGDATLAAGLTNPRTATCLTCHPDGSTQTGRATIHHDSKNGYAAAGNCAACHTTAGHEGDHSARVALYTNCAACHTGTEGTASGMMVNATNNKQHDACTTCHATTGALKSTADLTRGIVVAMPAGGGDCSACHGEYFPNHQNIDHATSRVTVNANCANCHDTAAGGSAPDAITSPFVGTGEVHGLQGCYTCHQANGTLVATSNVAPGIAAGGGDCETCHGAYFPNHQSPDHSAKVAGVTPCTDCHTATAGSVAGIPTSTVDNKVHDGCATCHNTTTGLLVGTPTPNGWAVAVVAGDCATCHGNYFDNHVHGTSGGYVSHDVSHDPTVDLAQSAPGTPCRDCHDDAGLGKGTNALSTWDAILTEHATVGGTAQTSACATCHDYATNGNQSGDPDTPPLTTVQNTIATGTGVTCVTCHVPKDVNASPATSGHGGHNASVFGWSGTCNNCHTDNGLGVVEGVHNNTCTLCHDNPSGGPGTTIVGVNGNGDATLGAALADYTTATCLTCHPSSTYPAPAIHHDTVNAQSGNCEWCHADPRPDWASQYGVNLPNPLPTSDMACKKCHIKGSGTGLTVYRNSYTPVAVSGYYKDEKSWGVIGDAAVQQTPVHVIAGASLITVQNYGICLGCHDGTYTNAQGKVAKQIQVWHAKPSWNKDTDDTANGIYDNTFDVMRNAPGRSYFANNNTPPKGGDDRNADDRRFNIFSTGANTGGVEKVRMYGRYNFGNATQPYKKTNSQNRGKGFYKNYQKDTDNPWINSVWSNRRTIPRIDAVNNPWGLLSSDPQVPIVP